MRLYRWMNYAARISFFLLICFACITHCEFPAFSQRQRPRAKGDVELRFCCIKEGPACTPALLKKNSEMFFVNTGSFAGLEDIAAAEVKAYYHLPRYELRLDRDGNEVSTAVYFNDFRVLLSFTDSGSKKIKEIFSRNRGKQVAIFFEKEPVMVLKSPFPGFEGELEVAGDFTEKGASALVESINKAIKDNKKR